NRESEKLIWAGTFSPSAIEQIQNKSAHQNASGAHEINPGLHNQKEKGSKKGKKGKKGKKLFAFFALLALFASLLDFLNARRKSHCEAVFGITGSMIADGWSASW